MLGRKLVGHKRENAFGEEELEFEDRGLDVPVQDVTVKAVCGSCNNGWMGDLELRMKRLYTRLIAGKVPLDRDNFDLIERWAVKTAIMWQYNHPETVIARPAQRQALFDGDVVPGASIRVGRRKYWDRDGIFIFGTTLRTTADDDGTGRTEPTVVVTLIAIGPLVIVQTLGHHRDAMRMESVTAYPGSKIRPLRVGLVWPGAFLRMSVREFDELVYRVGGSEEVEMTEFLQWKRAGLRGE